MDEFCKEIDVELIKESGPAKYREVRKAVGLICRTHAFQRNVEIAKVILTVDWTYTYLFAGDVMYNVDVAKLVVKHLMYEYHFHQSVVDHPEFVEFVFRENPYYARFVVPGPCVDQVFTPQFLEFVMEQVRSMRFSHEVIVSIPVVKRRMYANRKLRECEGFRELIFEDRGNIVSRLPIVLKQHTAAYIGLVTSARWLQVLKLIEHGIY